MLDMVNSGDPVFVHYPHLIKRNERSMTLEQPVMVVRLCMTCDKRRVVDVKWNTLSYG